MVIIIEFFLIAVGLSMDAFAVSVCLGLSVSRSLIKKSLIIGLYFGFFQAVMPLIGYMTATLFADKITAYDHWIAFALLCFLGIKMIISGFKKDNPSEKPCSNQERSLNPAHMLPLAVATSIDALAVGVSLAFLRINIIPAVFCIGIITFVISIIGVKIGNIFGTGIKSKAEYFGGAILILIGIKILLEHLFFS